MAVLKKIQKRMEAHLEDECHTATVSKLKSVLSAEGPLDMATLADMRQQRVRLAQMTSQEFQQTNAEVFVAVDHQLGRACSRIQDGLVAEYSTVAMWVCSACHQLPTHVSMRAGARRHNQRLAIALC